MPGHRFVRYEFERLPPERMLERARGFHERMDARRSVREFSPDPVPRELIELAVRTASTAPSGAHRQPWTFVLVGDAELKREIRVAAEREERVSYERRMSDEAGGAHAARDRLAQALPRDRAVDRGGVEQLWAEEGDGTRRKNYYVRESVGIACGIFIAALHTMGLATLTHTPSPMGFLAEILGRPRNERPFILFPIGYPSPDALVPDLQRKPLEHVLIERP
jgi:iodotyrosine deiodinase